MDHRTCNLCGINHTPAACPNRSKAEDYTLEKPKRYRITNRASSQTCEASAFSADQACRKLGWMIGDCHVQELGVG